MVSTKLKESEWQELLAKVKEGGKVSDLAKEYGVDRRAIYFRLGPKSEESSSTLEVSRLKRENKALKELIGKITYELSKEKKEL